MRKLFNISSDTSSEISQDEELPVTTTATRKVQWAATAATTDMSLTAKAATVTGTQRQWQHKRQLQRQKHQLLQTMAIPLFSLCVIPCFEIYHTKVNFTAPLYSCSLLKMKNETR